MNSRKQLVTGDSDTTKLLLHQTPPGVVHQVSRFCPFPWLALCAHLSVHYGGAKASRCVEIVVLKVEICLGT